jgi:hypothetical protein
MTSKEKSKELINKFTDPVRWKLGQENVSQRAKECALIAVDEILHSLEYNTWQNKEILKYYEEVKQEIEKIDKL